MRLKGPSRVQVWILCGGVKFWSRAFVDLDVLYPQHLRGSNVAMIISQNDVGDEARLAKRDCGSTGYA